MMRSPRGQIASAVVMMVVAVVLAFLMVLRLIEPTLGLCFASFILSVGGILLGMIGLSHYVRPRDGGKG